LFGYDWLSKELGSAVSGICPKPSAFILLLRSLSLPILCFVSDLLDLGILDTNSLARPGPNNSWLTGWVWLQRPFVADEFVRTEVRLLDGVWLWAPLMFYIAVSQFLRVSSLCAIYWGSFLSIGQ
jgi:hypothetical protein